MEVDGWNPPFLYYFPKEGTEQGAKRGIFPVLGATPLTWEMASLYQKYIYMYIMVIIIVIIIFIIFIIIIILIQPEGLL